MNINHNYQLLEQIHETNIYVAHRAIRKGDDKSYVVKVLKARYPSTSAISLFQKESSLICSMDLEGIVHSHGLIEVEGKIGVIMEDWNGQPLTEAFQKRTDLRLFLDMAISLANTLGNLHQNNIIFRDINPNNILVNQQTGDVKLTNFGLESILIREHREIVTLHAEIEDLVYLSPEQTGRMNVSVDHRCDLYSLGIVLYELLAGDDPLEAEAPLEIIHAHLAKNFTPLCRKSLKTPDVISHIVMKLLAKSPDERYQSAFGLKEDLRKCLHRLKKYGTITSFDIGENDIPIRFIIPNVLVGRENEIQELLGIYDRVQRGANETVLVMGPPGIGKTVMVREVAASIVATKGYFISGKCEPMPDSPYSSTIQAWTELIRQILTESPDKIQQWREKLLNAFGRHGKLLTDVIPDLERIIGQQPELGDVNTRDRFTLFDLVSKNLIKVFATKEHPLTLFLDDLQWVDRATLTLTAVLDQSITHFYFIGAFRDNEVDASHPLTFMTNVVLSKKNISFIRISGLDKEETHQLIGGFLKSPADESRPLSDLVWKKTGGNPFFINQWMKNLYETQMLTLDPDAGWRWDLAKIQEIQVTDNILALLESKIGLLQGQVKDTLKVCSCLGSSFDLEYLTMVISRPVDKVIEDLLSASKDGFIIMKDEKAWFQHDQIREAIYSSMSIPERQSIHYRIARAFLKMADDTSRQDNVFYIVNQFNQGSALITEESEKIELAYLNYECARKAKTASAYQIAYDYSGKALAMLPMNSWTTHYELTLAVYAGFVEFAYLKGDFTKIEELGRIALTHARSLLDKMGIYEAQIKACIAQQDLQRAVQIGIHSLIAYHYPRKAVKWDIIKGLVKLKIMMIGKTIDAIGELPDATDPTTLSLMRIGTIMGHALYSTDSQLFALYVILNIQTALKKGLAPEIPQNLVSYGIILMTSLGDIDRGYRFGELAMTLTKRPQGKNFRSIVIFMYNMLIRHWCEHIRDTVDDFTKGYHAGIESADLLYAALNLTSKNIMAYHAGYELSVLEKEMRENLVTIVGLNQEPSVDQQRIHYQAVLNLLGHSDDPTRLSGDAFDEDEALFRWNELNFRPVIASYHAVKLVIDSLFHKYSQAFISLQEVKKHAMFVSGSVIDRDLPFYDSLVRLALYPEASPLKKAIHLICVKKNMKKLRKMVLHAPMNNLHRLHLVSAEYARVSGNRDRAEKSYDKAIRYAEENLYIQEEGRANELAARYYFSIDQEQTARNYINDAYTCYEKWGAIAKLKDLEIHYGQYLTRLHQVSLEPEAKDRRQNTPQAIDLSTVIKASMAISGEISYSGLLAKTVKVIIENTGADKSIVILKIRDRLLVEAKGEANIEEVVVRQSIPVEEYEGVSCAIVNHVAMTQNVLCLSNPSLEGNYVNDPHVLKNRPKSILCSPILNKGKLVGILYLENHLAEEGFTKERLDLLNILTSQIAISMDNVTFYEQMEEEVKERTKDLQAAVRELNIEVNRRQAAEEELNVSHYRLTRILDSTTHTIIVVNQLMEVTFFNKGAEELFLYDSKEILGQPVFLLLPADVHGEFEDKLCSIADLSGSAAKRGHLRINMQSRDGSRFQADIALAEITIEDEPFYSMILRSAVDPDSVNASGETDAAGLDNAAPLPGDFGDWFKTLESAIKDISQQLTPHYFEEPQLRDQIAKMMKLALSVWETTTKKTKIDLAEESGLWRAYCDNGTWRTRTLDKYLSQETLPKKLRYQDVMKTVDFVLKCSPEGSEEARQLETMLLNFGDILVKFDAGRGLT